jgi:hypothetical protein
MIATPAGTEIPPRYRRDTAETGIACHRNRGARLGEAHLRRITARGAALRAADSLRSAARADHRRVPGPPRVPQSRRFGPGGMLTAMLDLAMSFAVPCALEDGHVVSSLEVKTSFIAPARPGAIVGDGMLVRKDAASPSWKAGSPTRGATFSSPRAPPARAGRGVMRGPRQTRRPPCGQAGRPIKVGGNKDHSPSRPPVRLGKSW